MRARYEKSIFLKILKDAPFISYAAKKSGISRATIYRWEKTNPEFREEIEEALEEGRRHLCNAAEMALVEKINQKDMSAIKFLLQHNDKRYRPMRTAFIPPLPQKELKPGEYCGVCGSGKLSELSDKELMEQMVDLLECSGYTVTKLENNPPETFNYSK